MRRPNLIFVLIFVCLVIVQTGCKLFSSVNPFDTTQSTTPTSLLLTGPISTVQTPTISVQTATSSKLRSGEYWCRECISDQFLVDFQVIGGDPPLIWLSSSISVSVDRDGNVIAGGAFFWIETNPAGRETCTGGEYKFDQITSTGFYNSAENILIVEMSGEESYSPLGGGSRCYDSAIVGQTTKQFNFVVDDQGNLVLCKPGEIGGACLMNPMAVLTNH